MTVLYTGPEVFSIPSDAIVVVVLVVNVVVFNTSNFG